MQTIKTFILPLWALSALRNFTKGVMSEDKIEAEMIAKFVERTGFQSVGNISQPYPSQTNDIGGLPCEVVSAECLVKSKIQTIDIQAREWWDKTNGNSYFSAQVTTNFGMPNQKTYYLPFQYGYGDHYVHEAKTLLHFQNVIGTTDQRTALWAWCKENGIVLRNNKQDKCTQREVKDWGHNPDHIYRVSYKREGYTRRQKSGLFNHFDAQKYADEINAGVYIRHSDAKVKLA